ncbi:MAG: MFS transporter, partial [Terriglobales bacterium]
MSKITDDIDLGIKVVSKVTRRLLPFLFLLYIVNYLDRINVGFAALQMRGQLGFSDKVYGLGAGIFFAGYFFFQVPSNLALSRVGIRKWIAVIMVFWGMVSISMIFVTTPRSFYVLRFLLGVAEAGFFPGIILYLRRWFPSAARARAVALFVMASPLAGVVGGPISGALLGVHAGNLAGWQWLFVIEGLPAVLLGGVVLAFLTDRPEVAPWLTTEERTWLTGELAREQNAHPQASRRDVFAAFTQGKVWLLVVVYL